MIFQKQRKREGGRERNFFFFYAPSTRREIERKRKGRRERELITIRGVFSGCQTLSKYTVQNSIQM